MGAVALRARAELRSRLRSWVGLALVVGLVAGVAIAAAAGARRTDSAYERFLVRQRAADVFVDNYPDPGVATVDPRAVERLPQVKAAARAAFLFVSEVGALAPADARLGRDVNRLELLRGRLPAQRRVNEVAVGFERAEREGWRPGTTIPLIERRYAAEARRAGVRNIELRVTGIVAAPGDFPPLVEQGRPSIYMTRAFYRAYEDSALFEGGAGQAVLARLKRGAADVADFRAGVERLARGKPSAVAAEAQHAEHVERSLDLQAAALWVLSALVAVTGAVILSQALARQAFLDSGQHNTLRALGMTRAQLFAGAMLRALTVGAIGAAIAVAAAVALSPLTPLGSLARTAEPDPGVAVDATVLGVGAAFTVLVALLVAAPSAWLAARGVRARPAGGAGAAAAALLARMGAGAPVVAGVRMALETGHGRSAVPVRAAIVAVSAGTMALAAALTFGSSSGHLLDTPRLYGWNWDLALTNYLSGPDLGRRGPPVFARERAIEEYSTGSIGMPLTVNGRRIDGIALDRGRGSVLPPIVEGRAPAAAGEVALGAKTMRELGVGIGDSVQVARTGAGAARMRVVGQGVLSSGGSSSGRLGRGAILRHRDVRRMARRVPAADVVLRLAPGADRRALVRRLDDRLGALYPIRRQEPLDIVDFGRVRGLPLIIAGLMAAFAAATLAHVLMSAVRRRRRDLAVLGTLGFVRRQLRTVVLAQSLTYAATAVLIGLPLGGAAGRFAWNVYAERQGIVEQVVVPVPTLLLAIPAAAVVAAALAVVPARVAATTRPAAVLRAE